MPTKKIPVTKSPKPKAAKKTAAKPRASKKKESGEGLSSTKKKIVVRQIKAGADKKEQVQEPIAGAAAVSQAEGRKNILAVHRTSESQAEKSLAADFREKLPASTAVKTETAEVRHFDLDEKINFKNLNGRSHNIYRKIAFSFLIFTSLLLVAVLYLYYVKVDISIVLNKQQISGNAVINITSDVLASSTTSNLPGVVKEIDLTQAKDFSATGKEVQGSDVTGKVRITNKYVRNQPLVASTRLLSTDNQLVRLRETVTVPAGGSVEAEVFTTEATSSVNIAEGTKLTIPGLWQGIQDKIYAESITPITYQEKVKKIVAETDIESAKAAMKQDLEDRAKTEVLEAYKSQYSQVLYKIDDNSFVATANAKAGDAKDTFTVKANAKVVVVAFNDESAKKQAEDQLLAQLPGDKGLAEFDSSSVTYELGNVDLLSGVASVNVGYKGVVINKNKNVIDRSKIVGLTATQLESFIKNLKDENNNPIIDSYTITFTPSFIGRVPNWPDRININPISK
jgi:hypothetical protein